MSLGDGKWQPSKRGRPRKNLPALDQSRSPALQDRQDSRVAEQLAETAAAYELRSSHEETLSPFSTFLSEILRHDRATIGRLAAELEVAENTVYRWMNGSSEPRPAHLKKLIEALPDNRENLLAVVGLTFPDNLGEFSIPPREVHKDVYRHIMELYTTIHEPGARRWEILHAIFDNALLHFDPEHKGVAITYARLMPAHPDGIHSLYEAMMRGHNPWPAMLGNNVYLGSTTLAGTAAIQERLQVWNRLDESERLQFEIDDFEHSACACPVTFAGRIAGVLIVSSTLPAFFTQQVVRESVQEYAQLMALAFPENEFFPFSLLNLRPMPDLRWQREEIARTYVNRIISHARKMGSSRQEAEIQVRAHIETEFEELGASHHERRLAREDDLLKQLR
jgi:Helix-turn-helix